MRSRTYKIKNKTTAQFWTGYGSSFTDKGAEWASWDSAAYEIRRQLRLKHSSINAWLNDAEIVEYEVLVNELGTQSLTRAVMRSAFYDRMSKKYGATFTKHYHKLQENETTRGKYKYAIDVRRSEFSEFRVAMKNLGYSSRHYKKTDNWLWIEDEEVMLRAKLLNNVVQSVNIAVEEDEFEQQVNDAVQLVII